MANATTNALGFLSSLFYLLTLIGGVNWLVTAVRLTMSTSESVSGNTTTVEVVPDALSWGGDTVQLVIYYTVGASSVSLFFLTCAGYWVRKGEALISCERIPA